MYLTNSPTESYVFEFCEIRKPTSTAVDYDEIATLELPTPAKKGTPLDEALHDWTLSCLRSGLFDIGLYSGICNRIANDGEILDTLSSVLVCWDGKTELFTHAET